MIPWSPLFAHLAAAPKDYPIGATVKPDALTGYLHQRVKLGPDNSKPSITNLNALWWNCLTDESGNIYLSVANDAEWAEPYLVISHTEKVISIDFTFDQLGREVVIFLDRINNAYLYWFDPVLSYFVVTLIGVSSSISAGFDFVDNPSNPNSDALIFYTVGSYVYMRIQRDKWEIDYDYLITKNDDGITPVNGLEILSSGISVESRYQVIYRYLDDDYNPPPPVPPDIPPVAGSFGYKLSGYQSAIETRRTNMFTLGKDNSIAFYLDEIDFDKPEIALFSQNQDPNAGAFALSFTGSNYTAVRVAYGRTEYISTAPFPLQAGHWIIDVIDAHSTGKFDTLRLRCKPLGAEEYLTHSIDVRASAMRTEITAQFLIGAVSGYVGNLLYCLRAVIRDIQINATALNEHGLIDQNLPVELLKLPMIKSQAGSQLFVNSMDVPVLMNSAIIKDYRAANWVFIEG